LIASLDRYAYRTPNPRAVPPEEPEPGDATTSGEAAPEQTPDAESESAQLGPALQRLAAW
jgi:hypothetical protein